MAYREPEGRRDDTEPLCRFDTQRRVEFSDTDMGGIAHFSRYFAFVESAEYELMRSIGAPLPPEVGWPRVAASLEYHSPLYFGDVVDIHLEVRRVGNKSLTYDATLRKGDQLVAHGRITCVCCPLTEPLPLAARPIPETVARRLMAVPERDGD